MLAHYWTVTLPSLLYVAFCYPVLRLSQWGEWRVGRSAATTWFDARAFNA